MIVRSQPFRQWIEKLRDRKSKMRIELALRNIERHGQLLGDYKGVGGGVIELRFHFGSGYRVYCYEEKGTLLLLLMGGDKSTQQRDIEKAQELLKEWKRQ